MINAQAITAQDQRRRVLTRRERQIYDLLGGKLGVGALSLSGAQIAKAIGCKRGTVKIHLKAIRDKLALAEQAADSTKRRTTLAALASWLPGASASTEVHH